MKQLDKWQISLPEAGTNSSPKAIDLNQDGILDIVLGGGGKEYESSDYGVMAIDGKDGSLLWKKSARNQIVGSAVFKDITNDGIEDVFIGGRSAQLFALDGTKGTLIWEYLADYEGMDLVNDTTLLNFFNPQFIPDQDSDGVEDLLIAFGGFVKAKPQEKDRPHGYLMALSTKSGKVLRQVPMPDGKETYMSPVLLQRNNSLDIVFGSGGETVNGGLYIIPLNTFMESGLRNAQKLAGGNGKGFIAPPTLVDITNDGQLDIICNAVKGKIYAFDGISLEKIWEKDFGAALETYSMPAPFNYNNDGIPDFFVSYGIGIWPEIEQAIQMVIDGKSGNISYKDTLGTLQYVSPIVYDFSGDDIDDILFPVNLKFVDKARKLDLYKNKLIVYDFTKEEKRLGLSKDYTGTNLGATPLLSDLDQDGDLDIIYCTNGHPNDFFGYRGLVIDRIETKVDVGPLRWSEYMGIDSKAVYQTLRK